MASPAAVQGVGMESYPLRRYLLDKARGRAREYVPFIYGIDISVTALNTNTTGLVNLDTDAPFLMLYTVSELRDSITNPILIVPGTANLRIGGEGARTLTRTPCEIHHLYPQRGSCQLMPTAYPIEAGSQLHLTVNVANVVGNNLPLQMRFLHIGLKLYGYGSR